MGKGIVSLMNIMVFNVPAESVGALTILNDFYNEVKRCEEPNIHWIFVVSKPPLEETKNIKVLRFPWIKKSWFHRIYFDTMVAPKLVKKYKVSKILSLQNILIPNTSIPQILYVHNSLPFVDYKFTIKENILLWAYQNIIGRSILKSIKKADKVIVQTNWMRRACLDKTGVNKKKIEVAPPKINLKIDHFFSANEESLSAFFYPASGFSFKNHKIIVEACKTLQSMSVKKFKVIFTLKGDENKQISDIYSEVKKHSLPIEFVGSLSREEVFDFYTRSILLFPSYVETFGLPLLEAKLHKGIVLASDCPFSHEILDGYKNAYFFNPFNEIELAELMRSNKTYSDDSIIGITYNKNIISSILN